MVAAPLFGRIAGRCRDRAEDALHLSPPSGLPPQSAEPFFAAPAVGIEVRAQIGEAAVPKRLVEVGDVQIGLQDACGRDGGHLRRGAELAQLVHGLMQHLLPALQDVDEARMGAHEAVVRMGLEQRRQLRLGEVHAFAAQAGDAGLVDAIGGKAGGQDADGETGEGQPVPQGAPRALDQREIDQGD